MNQKEILELILSKVTQLDSKVTELDSKVTGLDNEVKIIRTRLDETYLMVTALNENKDFHKAEMDGLRLRINRVEGAMKAAANVVKEKLKEA